MSKPLELNVSRNAVSLQEPGGPGESTRALLALCVEGSRVGIMAVGEDENALRARLPARPEAPRPRGVRAKILESAERHMPKPEPSNQEPYRFYRPGDDPWWDRKWQSPYELRSGDPSRSENPRQIFLIEPLAEQSWSPHLTRGLLYYALWSNPLTGSRTWPAFRRPKLELHATGDFSELEYAELVDQLRSLWGPNRVQLPQGRTVGPPPRTLLQTVHEVGHIVFWIALAGALLLTRLGRSPSDAGTIALVVAALAIITSRVARTRMQAERPRRKAETAPTANASE